MDKLKEISSSLTHSFSVQERKNIALTGVVKIDSFDKEEFLLETSLGTMNIKGENLEVVRLDTYQGNLTIKGTINSITYIEVNGKDKFVLRNRKDFIAFYKYLTDFDVDKFIKDFKAFDKEENINEDFDED